MGKEEDKRLAKRRWAELEDSATSSPRQPRHSPRLLATPTPTQLQQPAAIFSAQRPPAAPSPSPLAPPQQHPEVFAPPPQPLEESAICYSCNCIGVGCEKTVHYCYCGYCAAAAEAIAAWLRGLPVPVEQQQQQQGFGFGDGGGAGAAVRSPRGVAAPAGLRLPVQQRRRLQVQDLGFGFGGGAGVGAAPSQQPPTNLAPPLTTQQQRIGAFDFGGAAAGSSGSAPWPLGTPVAQPPQETTNQGGFGEAGSLVAAVNRIVLDGMLMMTNADVDISASVDISRLIYAVKTNKSAGVQQQNRDERQDLNAALNAPFMPDDVLAVLRQKQRAAEQQHATEQRRRRELEAETEIARVFEFGAKLQAMYVQFMLDKDALRRQAAMASVERGSGSGAVGDLDLLEEQLTERLLQEERLTRQRFMEGLRQRAPEVLRAPDPEPRPPPAVVTPQLRRDAAMRLQRLLRLELAFPGQPAPAGQQAVPEKQQPEEGQASGDGAAAAGVMAPPQPPTPSWDQ